MAFQQRAGMWVHAVWVHGGGTNQATLSDLERQEKERASFLSPWFDVSESLYPGDRLVMEVSNQKLCLWTVPKWGPGIWVVSFHFQNEAGFLFYKNRAGSGLKTRVKHADAWRWRSKELHKFFWVIEAGLKTEAEEAVGAKPESVRLFIPRKEKNPEQSSE